MLEPTTTLSIGPRAFDGDVDRLPLQRKPRLVYITTAPMSLRNLCEGQLAFFREQGYEVIAVSNPGADLQVVAQREGVQVIAIPMEREIRPWRDFISLLKLWRLMRTVRPDVVTAGTSKACLLGMLAGRLTGVPVRIYQLWGLRLETVHGIKRSILRIAERLTAASSNRVLCASESLRREYLAQKCAASEKVVVLLQGSTNGIDVQRFAQTPAVQQRAQQLRAQWGVLPEEPVIGFVGRFVRDKGIGELVDAFENILAVRPDTWLLLVGDYEAGDPVPEEYVQRIASHPRIIRPGFVTELTPYYSTMSVFAFPSYREGFPNVVLQAAAAELPVVTFRATGSVDAVQDGVTGTIVELGDADGLASALLRYLNDDELRRRHGQAGRQRALTDFCPEPIWEVMDAQFRDLLTKHGRPLPRVGTAAE